MRSLWHGLLLSAAGVLLSGCSLPYYSQAIGGQIRLLRQRTPIEDILADSEQAPALKNELGRIDEILRFATARLSLPDGGSYSSYVELDRSYVVWNVVAAEEFSVEPVRWCFPFAGCVSYRGYFDRAAALRYQAKLERRGYDTYSGGASAYSTLGHFDDPVLSTMLNGGAEYLAGLLFHELAHQRLYFKGDSELNEAFASAVEESGMELWLAAHGTAAELDRYRARLERRNAFSALVRRQQDRLAEIYAGPAGDAEKRVAKADAFAAMRREYAALKAGWGGSGDYDAWFEAGPNNASLAAVATYRRWLPALRGRIAELGFEPFYDEIERLAKLDEEQRQARLTAWLEQASGPVKPDLGGY